MKCRWAKADTLLAVVFSSEDAMMPEAKPNDPGSLEYPSRPKTDLLVVGGEAAPLAEHGNHSGQREPSNSASLPSFGPDGSTILRALRRRWVPVLLLGMLFAAGAALATPWLLPLKYTARVRFHIATLPPSVVFEAREGSADFANFIRTQVELIKSQLVLDEVVNRPEVADLAIIREQPAPIHWIEQQLICDFPAPEILRLSLNGKEPHELDTLLTAIKDAYLEKVANKEKNKRIEKLKRLSGIRKKWEDDLKEQRTIFQKKAKEAGSGDSQTLAFSHRLALERLDLARRDLLQYQSELRRAEAELKYREREMKESPTPAPTVPDSEIEERLKQDKEVSGLLVQRAELDKRLKKARQEVMEDHPLIGKYELELVANAEALAARKREARPLVVKELSEERRKSPSSTSQFREQVVVFKELIDQLNGEINRLNDETKLIKDSSLELETIRDKITPVENVAKAVAGRVEAINVEVDAPSRVTLLEQPTVINLIDGKKKAMARGCAALVGFALATFSVVGWDLRMRRVFHPAAVSRALNTRVLGTLPLLGAQTTMQSDPLGNSSLTDKYPRYLVTESVDRARLKLLHAAVEHSLRTVLITSAVSGEGKTTLASHLAVSLARAGRRTLLIDADMRRPSLHRLFELPLEPGLGAFLREELPAADVIRPTFVSGLEVIPAGRGDVSAIDALGHDKLRMTLEHLKGQYDFILVDSTPLLAVVDAPLIAQYVDGVLFSVMYGVSHLNALHECHQELAQLGVRILGAVVSGASDSSHRYYGYPPYGYPPPGADQHSGA
jgi:succinoglycan biosynthesis transport protein ExoP